METEQKILRAVDVARLVGFSTVTLWRLRKMGKFPNPIKLTSRTVGWRRSDVEDWLAARPAATAKEG